MIAYTIHLADNALILGHRNSEWTGHGPVLEQDIALSNIALDLIGQARNLFQYAAVLINDSGFRNDADKIVTEDSLAYLRDVREFRNSLLAELENDDWGRTVLKQFFFSVYQFYLYQQLLGSRDKQLAAIAEKSLKEVTYHLKWSAEWVIRLGDGTTESHTRMRKALEDTCAYCGELYTPSWYETELALAGIAADLSIVKNKWTDKVKEVFTEATLLPHLNSIENLWMQVGGKEGLHTEHLGFLLAEMQYLQRTYPDAEW